MKNRYLMCLGLLLLFFSGCQLTPPDVKSATEASAQGAAPAVEEMGHSPITFSTFSSGFSVVRVTGSVAALSNWSANSAPALSLISNRVWQGTIQLPAGSVQYKLVMNNTWTTNFGLGTAIGTGVPQTVTNLAFNGGNISVNIPSNGRYVFTYFEAQRRLTITPAQANNGAVPTNTNVFRVHYFRQGWATVNIHFNNGTGWTVSPGLPMTAIGGSWHRRDIPMQSNVLTFVFNNGAGVWDNSHNTNYRTTAREIWVSNGVIRTSTNNVPPPPPPPPPPAGGYTEFPVPFAGNGLDIILQGFHWASTNGAWWTTIANNANTIAVAGFTMVWFPPVSDAGDNAGYLPRRWYNLTSRYGSPAQLSNAISALRTRGVRAIADIVVNHRVGTLGWADFTEPAFPDNRAAVVRNDEWTATHGGPGTGALDTGDNFHAGRDLDHTNPHVRTEIINWMRWLRRIGFDGWRYDYVRGFHSTFVSNYNMATMPYFSVGELWPDIPGGSYYASGSGANFHRQALVNWINNSGGRSTAFDFTTKWQLQLAIRRTEYWRLRGPDGRPIGLIGWWPAMSVTFIDNHDTGPSPGGGQAHWPFPQAQREIGYAYILTHPGIPSVYWFDYFDSGSTLRNQINTLIAIRRAQRISATSPITILRADANEYVAQINNNTIVRLGPGRAFTTTWRLAASGNNWAVWTNTNR